jgi:hypothetical protein
MNIADWDRQFERLANECDVLIDHQSKSQVSHDRAFTLRTMAIMQEQDLLNQRLDALRNLAGRDVFLLPREKAMVHGVRTLLERIDEYATVRNDILTQGLWFNLLKTRLLGPQNNRKNKTDIYASEDLVTLSLRNRNLAATETYLESRLVQLDQRRRELTTAYQQLDLEDANRIAARTYATRLGPNLASAASSPLMSGLKLFLQSAKADALRDTKLSHYRRHSERLELRSSGVLALCREFILKRLMGGGSAERSPVMRESGTERRSKAQDVTRLARQVARAELLAEATSGELAAALSLPALPSAPIRVQKTKKPTKKKQ